MGGMSSLSIDNMFSPDAASRRDGAVHAVSDGKIGKLPVPWSDPLDKILPTQGATAAASRWALSGARRILDCAVAATALIAFLPVMGLAAFLVRFGSPGPVFFRQRRMGRNGREFTLYKFRSMDPRGGRNSCITVSGDSRITPVGALLRRYKLDELPQFWNVLRGDMCLVGPRPKLPHHEALHMACRPGITGAATLAFRNEEEFLAEIPGDQLETFYELFVKPAKAQLDLQYMRTATFMSDLRLIWRTAAACFFSDDSMAQSAEMIAQYELSRKEWTKRVSGGVSRPMPAQRVYSAGMNSEL
jgi:lipopolysaccharide/colanic/teichoic acid biosynthesis glycosyltransferase